MKTKDLPQHTILWADDDPDDRQVICDIVYAHYSDFQVHVVENGDAVLAHLDSITDPAHFPCLVVLDINMPKRTGLETLAHLKSDERYKNLRVAVFTTSGNIRDRQVCQRYGVPMVTKPYSYSGFEQAVKQLLQLCNLQGQDGAQD